MIYQQTVSGKFIDRPNRFIAYVEINGAAETVHVKNTGRCKELLLPEHVYGNSRVDFYLECGERKIFIEVKGCTLEIGGTGYFPDAPTERGVKHLNELIKAVNEGYEAYIAFATDYIVCGRVLFRRENTGGTAD